MAAIGRRNLLALLAAAAVPLRASQAEDVRAQITYVASALASGNPTDALGPFAKTMPDYEKLSQYFGALTTSFEIVNELEIGNEDDTASESIVKLAWTLQLEDRASNSTKRRTTNVTIHLKPEGGKWKIVSFSPIAMFDPQAP